MLSFDHRGEPSIGGADSSVIPVADEISPDDRPEFTRGHFFRIITVIQQFLFHPCPHTFTAGIIMASAVCAVHALLYAVLTDRIAVKLAGVLAPPV